jgi:hypothetical protein
MTRRRSAVRLRGPRPPLGLVFDPDGLGDPVDVVDRRPAPSVRPVIVTASFPPAGRHVVSGITWIIYLAFIVATIAAWWMIFTKAGEAGWKSIIPIYNIIVILKIVGRDWWWVILMLIPIVNLIVWILVSLDLAKSFGRGTGFGIGLAFLSPIFGLILGFGSDTYKGPAAKPA